MADLAKIKPAVLEALRIAKENGTTFGGWTNQEIAVDIIDCDADISDLTGGEDGVDDEAFKMIVDAIIEARAIAAKEIK